MKAKYFQPEMQWVDVPLNAIVATSDASAKSLENLEILDDYYNDGNFWN